MNECVVDASVAAKWFLVEEHSADAESLLGGVPVLRGPSHLYVELVNVFWKKHRSGDLSASDAVEAASRVDGLPVMLTAAASLLGQALDIAIEHDRSVYDSLYLALALRHDCPLVTADRRFYNALIDLYPEHLTWVGDLEDAGE